MPRMLNILFVSAHDPDVGAPHHTMAAMWLASRGWPVRILSAGAPDRVSFRTPLGNVPATGVPKLPGWPGKIRWHLQMFLNLFLERLKGQTNFYYIEGSPVTPVALVALLFVPDKNIIYHTQDYLEPARYWFRATIEKLFARRAGLVICNEPARARFMASHYSLPQVPMVIRTALPSTWATPDRDPAIRKTLLGHLGFEGESQWKLVLHQGPYSDVRCSEALLRALALLPRHYLVVFTGTRPNTQEEQLAKNAARKFGVEQQIIFVDRKPFEDLLRITASCDVGVLLYPDDGIGNFFQAPGRLTEYIGCGLPVIASSFPGLELTILKHRLGAVCDQSKPDSIAEAISSVCENNVSPNLGARLKTVARDELSYEYMAHQIEDYLLSFG